MATQSSSRLTDLRTPPPPAFAITVPVRLVGTIVLVTIALTLVALATWAVDDPSLSYATPKPAANWLGYPGAVVADLLFQVLGVAVIALLLPPALWGWQMVHRRMPSRMVLRLVTWLAATVLATGVLGFVAVPESWPLPTGLGGLTGMGFYNLATLVGGTEPVGITATLFAILLGAPALFALWIATGLGGGGPRPVVERQEPQISKKSRGRVPQAEPETDGEAEGNPIMDVAMGAVTHMGFVARSAWKRARSHAQERAARQEPDWREQGVEPSLTPQQAAEPVLRREPQLVTTRGPAARIGRQTEPPLVEEDFYPQDSQDDEGFPDDAIEPGPYGGSYEPELDDEPMAPPVVAAPPVMPPAARPARQPTMAQPAPVPQRRVAAPVASPVPGQRLAREAQGSLLYHDGFELPPLTLLAEPQRKGLSPDHMPERLEANARRLEGVLEDFGVKGDIINVRPGPVVTLYELEPAPGIKSSRVISLADDIARSMSAISARVQVVPGRNAIGIELPNQNRETVYLREMLASSDFEKMKGKLPICLGKTIGGEPIIVDLARMPHLLIAGTTGSGKSVGINTMILSLLYRMTPEECRLIMIDPKMLELSVYDGIPHLLTPVVTDPSKAVVALKWAVREMEDRYRKMSKIGVRNIDGFNQRVQEAKKKGEVITRTVQTGFDRETGEPIFESEQFDLEPLPFIVVIVDEMADLMMVAGKDIEGAIQRLAQMARAAGIHMVTATQRPSVDVITGTIKANFPTRISFQVTSKIDSRTILGEQGAEQLLGQGDMLYMAGGGRVRRLHGPFVADGEVEAIVAHLKAQGSPDYLDSITAEEDEDGAPVEGGDDYAGSGDELYDKAVHIVLTDKKASTSYIQRRLAIGYNKAATLIERMEREGVISQANHAGKREILVGSDQ